MNCFLPTTSSVVSPIDLSGGVKWKKLPDFSSFSPIFPDFSRFLAIFSLSGVALCPLATPVATPLPTTSPFQVVDPSFWRESQYLCIWHHLVENKGIYHFHEHANCCTIMPGLYPDTGDQCSQLIVATLVPSTPICLFFNLAKLQCYKQTVVTDFCIGFVNKIHISGK